MSTLATGPRIIIDDRTVKPHIPIQISAKGYLFGKGSGIIPEEVQKIKVEVWRPALYVVFTGVSPKVIVDGETVGRIKNGESIFFETTPGQHEVQVKALTTHNYKGTFDLKEGSIIKVGTDLVGWFLEPVDSKES